MFNEELLQQMQKELKQIKERLLAIEKEQRQIKEDILSGDPKTRMHKRLLDKPAENDNRKEKIDNQIKIEI